MSELKTGAKTITFKEYKTKLNAFGKKHGLPAISEKVWAYLEKMFADMDKDGDGALDIKEFFGPQGP